MPKRGLGTTFFILAIVLTEWTPDRPVPEALSHQTKWGPVPCTHTWPSHYQPGHGAGLQLIVLMPTYRGTRGPKHAGAIGADGLPRLGPVALQGQWATCSDHRDMVASTLRCAWLRVLCGMCCSNALIPAERLGCQPVGHDGCGPWLGPGPAVAGTPLSAMVGCRPRYRCVLCCGPRGCPVCASENTHAPMYVHASWEPCGWVAGATLCAARRILMAQCLSRPLMGTRIPGPVCWWCCWVAAGGLPTPQGPVPAHIWPCSCIAAPPPGAWCGPWPGPPIPVAAYMPKKPPMKR